MKDWAIGLIVLFSLSCVLIATAADFNGNGRDDRAVFRPGSGLWAIDGQANFYFGQGGDIPIPMDIDGDGTDEATIFRPKTGLWADEEGRRSYFGSEGDVPLGKGGYNPYTSQYDYVVKPGDGDDLVRALESNTYRSVFIPAGTYNVSEIINVGHVRRISGEEQRGTEIIFAAGSGAYLSIQASHCHVEGIRVERGGSPTRGSIWTNADYVTFRECLVTLSEGDAFRYDAGAAYVSFIDCLANQAAGANSAGFKGPAIDKKDVRFTNCVARRCEGYGFYFCYNLSSCYVHGNGLTGSGFYYSSNISSSIAVACATNGFVGCGRVSACEVEGDSLTTTGFRQCSYLAACRVHEVTGTEYYNCNWRDPDSCD